MAVLPIAACSPDPNEVLPVGAAIPWEVCPLFVEGHERVLAQCATVDVPLAWDDPGGPAIELFVQRRISGMATRQLWMLAGGPGQPGSVYETYIRDLSAEDPDTDFYTLDHRGVGRSTRLGCPAEEDPGGDGGIDVTAEEWPGCLAAVTSEWDADLARFSITEAARDLEGLLTLADDGGAQFVYGGSYGTTLAHRFLQLFPDRVDGVVLDSIAVDVDHRAYDAEFDEVTRAFFTDLCGADDRCAEELGPDPAATAAAVVEAMAGGHCADAIDVDTFRRGLALFVADSALRGYAPALVHRAERCREDDVKEIRRLVALLTDRPPHYTELQASPVLFANIELSEQWPEPWPTVAETEAVVAATVASFAIGPSQRPLLDVWPRYPLDEHHGRIAVTDTPVLMLQGAYDPQTPPWRTDGLAAALDGPGQHRVSFPFGTHILLRATPAPGGDCATRLVRGFMDDPLAEPDASCVDEVDPPRFTGQPFTSWLLLSDAGRYGDCRCAGAGSGGWPAALAAAAAISRRRASTPSSRRGSRGASAGSRASSR